MEPIERAANLSVGRACGFCGLAIVCFMVGFSHDPHIAARVGGSFALGTSIVLVVKAMLALRTPYKQTETWLILDESARPPPAQAQQSIGLVRRRVFIIYARYCALTAAILLASALILGMSNR
jgi:multisubunit Na+/H+ antiporter MnhB subunit